ncbi:MAG: DUF3489 domain-containing protein [Rhodobacteraceae bacterium]|nr:DUF3489 domain-containing protein [Paracoccaceae bacterium]
MTQSGSTKSVGPRARSARRSSSGNTKPVASKRDQLLARLQSRGGARLKDLETALRWQPHTVRAAISGLRKAGHDVQREAGSDGAVYRIVAPKATC